MSAHPDANSPLISVVMPTYRPTEYLRSAIESVQGQGLDDLEVIVVDDASPAEYQPFLDELAACYPIRVIRRERNGGPAAGHNTGLSHARGRYIAFLEHDDLFLPGKLAEQAAALEAHPEWGICYTGFTEIGPEGEMLRERPELCRNGEVGPRELLARNLIWSLSLVMARRSCLEEVGGLDESFSVSHDYDLWLRIALSRWRIGGIAGRLVGYRRHGGSWAAKNRVRGLEDRIRVLTKCREARPEVWAWAAGHHARCCYRLGRLHQQQGDSSAARDCFLAALASNRRHLKARLGLLQLRLLARR